MHADIKASNVLVGLGRGQCHHVYLVDFGLSRRFLFDGGHQDYRPDPKCAHDGTLEFTSIDAHDGASECAYASYPTH